MNLKNRIIALAVATAVVVPAAAIGAFEKKASPTSFVKVGADLPTGRVESDTLKSPDAVKISDNGTDFVVTVDLKKLDTKIKMRNDHFQGKVKSLTSTLTVKTADVKGKTSGTHTVPGVFRLNMVSRPVKVTYKVEDKGDHLKVSLLSIKDAKPSKKETKGVSHRDFEIGDAFCYLGVCVKDNLDITGELYTNKG